MQHPLSRDLRDSEARKATMAHSLSVVIFFDCERLPEPVRLIRSHRLSVVEAGIAALKAQFPALELGNRNASSGSVDAMVSAEELEQLVAFLDRPNAWGHVVVDQPMFRGAVLE
jgi:hypothetical protein